MISKDLESIKEHIKILRRAVCTKIGRSCNLVWLNFCIDKKEFVLDMQCAFRFVKSNVILCSNLDIYSPKNEYLNNPSFNYETFNWDVQGENYFDEWICKDENKMINSKVVDFFLSDYGDLHLKFDNDIGLMIFNNSLSECWRFFERQSSKHLVINGNSLEL